MKKLLDGVVEFQQHVFPEHQALFGELATSQNPETLFITCSDSRIDPNLLTQSKPGDLFICRNAGNIIPPHSQSTGGMTASIEYAVAVLGVRQIVICGHTDCGAMKGALDIASLDELPHVKEWLGHTRSAIEIVKAKHGPLDQSLLRKVTEENVLQQLQNLKTHPVVAAKLACGELSLHAWLYEIETGGVCCGNSKQREFLPLEQFYQQ